MPDRAAVIINPTMGRMSAVTIAERIRTVARARGIAIDVALTECPGHAAKLARSAVERADIVIAVGGDGTVSDVITGTVDADVPIGIIPVGSTNMVAKDLRIPGNVELAASIALGGGRLARLDVARVGTTTCVHIAGAGFDAEIMRRTSAAAKQRYGWLAYLPPAVRQLRYPPFSARIVVDGVPYRGRARLVLFALGASFIHPHFRIGDGIDRDDGLIDICIYNPPSLAATLACVGWIMLGRPGCSRWQRQLRGRQVEFATEPPVAVEVDGDFVGETPIEIAMLDRQVAVYVPIGSR